jgi:hypothetical protein
MRSSATFLKSGNKRPADSGEDRMARPSPDPGLGAPVELSRRHTGGLLDLLVIGKTLAGQGIAAEEAPPALLQIEPTGSSRNKDVMDAQMPLQPGARLQAAMTREIVRDNEDVPVRIVRFDLFEQLNVPFGVTRGSATGDLLAVTHPQRPVHPGFFRSPTIVQWRFDTVAVARPARGRIKGAWDYWSEFVGTDGRRSFGRLGVMDDDRRSDCGQSLCRAARSNCGYCASAPFRVRECGAPGCV